MVEFSQSLKNSLASLVGPAGVQELEEAMHSAAIASQYPAGVPVQPLLWFDPSDTATLDLDYAALFGATGAYLATADHADFDFSSVAKFSVVFCKNRRGRQDGLNGLDDGYIGQWEHSTSASWAIQSGGSSGHGTNLRILLATNAGGTTSAHVKTAAATLDWSWAMVTYDGSEVTHTDRVRLYLDGVLVDPGTYDVSGTVPESVNNATGSLTVGRGISAHGLADAAMNRVGVWKDRVLDADDAADLYNAGVPKYYADLSADNKTSLVAWWDLTEAAGQRRDDLSGGAHHLSETGGTVSQVTAVRRWRSKGDRRIELVGASMNTPTAISFGAAPLWEATGLNGTPAVRFAGYGGMRALSRNFAPSSFTVIEAVQYDTFASSETFNLMMADEASAAAYWFTGEITSDTLHYMWFRFRDTNSPNNFNTNVRATTPISTATAYVNVWRALGAGDASSFLHRNNGEEKSLIYADANAQNKSIDDIAGLDNVTLSTLVRSDGASPQIGKDMLLGPVIVYGSDLSNSQMLEVERSVSDLVGL